jgi:hypothetical protein
MRHHGGKPNRRELLDANPGGHPLQGTPENSHADRARDEMLGGSGRDFFMASPAAAVAK